MPKTVEAIIKNTSSLFSLIKNNSVRIMSWNLTLLIHFKILGNNSYYILILTVNAPVVNYVFTYDFYYLDLTIIILCEFVSYKV